MSSSFPMKRNVATTIVFPILDADGDLVGGATALDSEYSLDGGVFTDCTAEATNMTSGGANTGIYSLALAAGETNGDVVCIQVKTSSAGAKSTVLVFYTAARSVDDLAYPTTTGRSIDVTATGEVGIDWANIGGPTTVQGLSGTTVKTATDVEVDTGDIQSRLPAALVGGRIDSDIGAKTGNVALSVQEKLDVNAEADTALADIDLNHLIEITAGVEEPTDGSYLDQIMHKAVGQTFDATTDSLEALRDTEPMGTAMRGTDNAALASVCTDGRLSKLDATVASRAPEAGGNVAAIKTKTDSLTFTTAAKVDARVDYVGANAVTTPDDFKANVTNLDVAVSSRATQASILSDATPFAGASIAAILTDTGTTLDALITRALGLTQENFYIDQAVYDSGNMTSCRIRIYDSAANVGTGAGVVATFNVTVSYASGNLDTYSVKKA